MEYNFNYKPPEINIVNILTVFVYTLLYYLTFNAKHMLFYNHKAYSENICKFLDFSTQSHLLIFQVCCFTEGGGGSVGQKMKREHDLTFLKTKFLFLFYISFIFKKVILNFYRKFPLIFYISTFI